MDEERIILTKQDVKNAVGESLMDIIEAASTHRSPANEKWGASWVLEQVAKVLPVVVLALVSWVCLTIIDIQKDVVAMRLQVAQVENHLIEHNITTSKASAANAITHHTKLVSNNRCDSCHVQFYNPEDSDKAKAKAQSERDEMFKMLDTKKKK